MYRLPNQILFGLLSLVPLVGCAFSPGTPGEESGSGGASSTGSGVGSGGVSGIATGQGLTGGDIGRFAAPCGQRRILQRATVAEGQFPG